MFLRPLLVASQVPVEQVLIGADEEGARAAGGVEDAQVSGLLGDLAFEQTAHRVLDDVVDDVGRRVVDTAGLLDLGLVLDHGAVPGRETDYLAEELLVDLTEDIGRQDAELIGALRVVEAPEDVLERLVVDGEAEREAIGCVGTAPLVLEVEETRVVTVVGLDVELAQVRADVLAAHEAAQPPVGLDASVLADAQEDDAVDGRLHSVVELALTE